jgi:hypothetical protein
MAEEYDRSIVPPEVLQGMADEAADREAIRAKLAAEVQKLLAASEAAPVPPIGTVEISIGAVRLSLYCWACREVHTLLAERVEVLVYSLVALAGGGEYAMTDDLQDPPALCLLEAIRAGESSKGYLEHVEQGIACRIAATADAPKDPERDLIEHVNVSCDRCGDLGTHMIDGALLCDECAKDAAR